MSRGKATNDYDGGGKEANIGKELVGPVESPWARGCCSGETVFYFDRFGVTWWNVRRVIRED